MLLATLGIFLVPIIAMQANELLIRLPDWIKSGQNQLELLEKWTVTQQIPFDISSAFDQQLEKLTGILRSLTTQVLSLLLSTIGSIVNVFIT